MKRSRWAFLLLVLLLLLGSGGGLLLLSGGPGSAPAPLPPAPGAGPEEAAPGGDGDGVSASPGETAPPPAGTDPTAPPEEEGGSAGTPSAGAAEDAPAAPEPAGLPPGCHTPLAGRVVDLDTGKPIPGARVLYGPFPSWWGADAGEDGSFRFELDREDLAVGEMFRLRVSAPGYETYDAVPQAGEVRIELLPRAGSHRYGRIRGRAEDREGRVLSGALSVAVGDEETSRHYLTVFADERGRFELEGIEPGHLWIRLAWGEPVRIFLPEGGVREVVVRAGETAAELSNGEESAAWRLQLELEREALRAAQHRLLTGEPAKQALEAVEREIARVEDELSRLEIAARWKRERFPVRVTDLADAEGAVVVAEFHGSESIERWRAVVRDGEAAFPALFPGEWHLELRAPGTSREVVVEVAGGTRSLRFPGRSGKDR